MGEVCMTGRHQRDGGSDKPFHSTEASRALSEVIVGDLDKQLVRYRDISLYTLEATTSRILEKPFIFVQHLFHAVSTALRAFQENLLEYICTAVRFSELQSMAAKGA